MAEFEALGHGGSSAFFKQFLSQLFQQSVTPMVAQTGVLGSGLAVTQTVTASGSVLVAQGIAVAQGSATAGATPLINDTVKTLDVLVANPASANPRNDIVVFDAATTSIYPVIGTPNATPTDPTVPATAVALARLRVLGSATTIPTAQIDDLRTYTRLRDVPVIRNTAWLTGAGVFTAATGWSITGSLYKIYGDVVSVQINMTRTGAALGVGNVTNVDMVTLGSGLVPAQSNGALTAGASGPGFFAYASIGGKIVLTSTVSGIATSDVVSVFGTYIL